MSDSSLYSGRVHTDDLYQQPFYTYEEYPQIPYDYLAEDTYDLQSRPSTRTLVFILSVFLLYKCLLPATKTHFRALPFGLYIYDKEIAAVFLALIIGFVRLFNRSRSRISIQTKRKILMPLLLLGLFQVISMAWNGRQEIMYQAYSLLQVFMMCAAVFAAVMFISGLTYASRIYVVTRLVLILVFVLMVYMGLSFLFPSLRPSTAWMERTEYTLGFIRVFGPLAPASTLSFALFPALGYAISMLFMSGRSKGFWGAITLIVLIGIIGTGSRAAVLGLGSFVFVFMLVSKVRSLVFVLPVGVLLGIMVLYVGIPERYIHFKDTTRFETYTTGLRAFSSSPQAIMFGVGHGRLYSQLHENTFRMATRKASWHLRVRGTEYGVSFYESHSTIVRLLAETGLIGFCLFMVILVWLVFRLFALRYSRIKDPVMLQPRIALAGCVSTFILMPFDIYFLTYTWLTFIWLIFAIAAAETIGEVHAAFVENYWTDNNVGVERYSDSLVEPGD